MIYGSDAAATHLSNVYWYLHTGDMQTVQPSAENVTAMTNKGFILHWNRISATRKVQLFGRLNSDIRNVPLYLLPGGSLQIMLTKARPSFYLMNKSVDSKTVFNFSDAQLLVRRFRTNSTILLAHTVTLKCRGSLAPYNLARVTLNTFIFAAGSKSLSIDEPSSFPSRNVCCSPWLTIQILTVCWTATHTNFSIKTSAIFRYF